MNHVGHTDASSPGDALRLGFADLTPSPLVLRDVEAFLLGLLPDEHVLGGPVRSGPVGSVAVLDGADPQASGVLIRDEEHTPIAALTDLQHLRDSVVRGRLEPVRRRESGSRAELALSRTELAVGPAGTSTAVLVLDRPPTTADGATIADLLSAGWDTLWVVVADTPGNPLPLRTLVATVEAWLVGIGASPAPSGVGLHTLPGGGTVRLRTAPLGWRDPASDGVLVDRLGAVLGADATCWLRYGDDSAGSRLWQSLLTTLRRGATDRLGGVDDDVARILLRWRPARARRGVTLMFTGLSGSGKSTVARGVAAWLHAHTDRSVTLLDGDVVRQTLSSGLGFDRAGRVANVRRIGYVAAEVTRHGGVAICAPIAPYAETRAEVRHLVEAVGDFLLIHVNTPIEECERRDLKGLYARARAGTLPEFTGVSDPYDEPDDAVVRIDTSVLDEADAVAAVVSVLRAGGWLEGRFT